MLANIMADNPYRPPQSEPEHSLVPAGVIVRHRLPLDITADRTVDIDVATDVLEQRVQQAAQSCGYTIADRHGQQWTLKRGSVWHAIYTFGVRRLPTTATIEMKSPTRLHIHLHCHSALTISTPGDAKRLSHELDDLERAICLAGP